MNSWTPTTVNHKSFPESGPYEDEGRAWVNIETGRIIAVFAKGHVLHGVIVVELHSGDHNQVARLASFGAKYESPTDSESSTHRRVIASKCAEVALRVRDAFDLPQWAFVQD
jgi:hypothetical protein